MDRKSWYDEHVGNDTIKEAARKAGISTTTAWRQHAGGELNFSAENVILIARAYGADPVRALAAFGYLSESESVIEMDVGEVLRKAGLRRIVRELNHWIESDPDNPAWSAPPTVG